MDRKDKIAVAVKNDSAMWKGHFGMSPYYRIYDLNGNFLEQRENPFGLGNQKKHHDNPKLIVDLLKDCNIFIAVRMGEKSKSKLVENLGVIPVITKSESPIEAVKEYLSKK